VKASSNSNLYNDPILSAIEKVKLLIRCIDAPDAAKSRIGKSFRGRCRELPSLIEDVGFTPAMSFCYGKSGQKTYDEVKEKLEDGKKLSDEKETDRSYGIYLYFVLKRLNELELIDDKQVSDPVEGFKIIKEGKERIASKIIRPFIVQLKKLSEAVFEAE